MPADAPETASVLEGAGASRARRLATRALRTAQRRGWPARLPVARLRVSPTDDELLIAVRQHLPGANAVAVRLGAWAHARSVVLRVFDGSGSTLAFGKIGLDELGRASVAAESRALERVAALGLSRVRTSRVLAVAPWAGTTMLLVSPLTPSADRVDPPVAAMLELARAGDTAHRPLREGTWSARARERAAIVGDPALRAVFAEALDRLDAVDVALELGPWHGDWTRWNMAHDGDTVLLWDWEHFDEEAPVGFDLVHFLAQDLRTGTGTGDVAERLWLTSARRALEEHVGLQDEAATALLAAYLVDVNLRYVLDRLGTPLEGVPRAGWGLELLRSLTERLPSR